MKKTARISEAEWQVMEVLWKRSPLTANTIVEALTGATDWKRETIRTLINRLVQKKAVGFEPKGRRYHYYPLVKEGECLRAEARSFLQRFSSRSVEPVLVAFVEHAHLSHDQIERLRKILDEKGRKKRRPSRKHDL